MAVGDNVGEMDGWYVGVCVGCLDGDGVGSDVICMLSDIVYVKFEMLSTISVVEFIFVIRWQ